MFRVKEELAGLPSVDDAPLPEVACTSVAARVRLRWQSTTHTIRKLRERLGRIGSHGLEGARSNGEARRERTLSA